MFLDFIPAFWRPCKASNLIPYRMLLTIKEYGLLNIFHPRKEARSFACSYSNPKQWRKRRIGGSAKQLLIIAGLFHILIYANLAHSQTAATIRIDAAVTQGAVSPLLFGNNIEWDWLGNGIWNPQTNDFVEGIKPLLDPLKTSILRFPGGTLSDKYTWQSGIGTPTNRGLNPNFDGVLQKSLFGTDEFYRLLKVTGAKGIITVNAGTGIPEDAANWVEYCNGSEQTKWGKIRAQNGFPEPFNIKYWEIGNELYIATEPGSTDITTYAQKVIVFANAMKSKDSSIQIGAGVMADPGAFGAKDSTKKWNKTLLEIAGNYIDFVSVHIYAPGSDGQSIRFFSNGTKTLSFHCSEDAEFEFRILARGTPVSSVYPVMECQVNSKLPRQININSNQWKTYVLTEKLAAGSHQIKISFINDANRPPEDRNLFISRIEMHGPTGTTPIDITDKSELFKGTMASPKRIEWQLQELRKLIDTTVPGKSITIAATEFNAFYGTEPSQLALSADFKSALLAADMMHVFLRKQISIANFWSVLGNGGFGVIKDGQTLTKRPFYHALGLLACHKGNILLTTATVSPTFSSILFGDYANHKDVPYLSAISSISPDSKKLFFSVINKHEAESIQANISLSGFDPSPTAQVLTLTAPSASSSNEINPDTVKPSLATISSASQTFTYIFPAKSLTLMELTAKVRMLRPPTLRVLPP
jgi:alpha-L-arabinofuranosidase